MVLIKKILIIVSNIIEFWYFSQYRIVSNNDILFWKLSYRIEFWYFIFKFIVSYRILIFCFENYRIVSKFDILFWKLSYRIEFWYFVLKIIVSYRILIFFYQKYRIVSKFDNFRLNLTISYQCPNKIISYHWSTGTGPLFSIILPLKLSEES